MNTILAQQLHEVLAESGRSEQLTWEPSLRVAAATLGGAAERAITATRVVGVLGLDDVPRLQTLVADLAQQYELETSVKLREGSFSVHFRHGVHV